jgi:hypothetical protein
MVRNRAGDFFCELLPNGIDEPHGPVPDDELTLLGRGGRTILGHAGEVIEYIVGVIGKADDALGSSPDNRLTSPKRVASTQTESDANFPSLPGSSS